MKEVKVNCFKTCYGEEQINEWKKVPEALLDEHEKQGFIYVKLTQQGIREGSICKLKIDKPKIKAYNGYGRNSHTNMALYSRGTFTWDGRKNKIQGSLYSYGAVWLPGYTGETLYVYKDTKKIKQDILKNPNQHDIDNKLLSIGDSVLYINARYGSGMVLCHGIIKEFEVTVDQGTMKPYVETIVQRKDSVETSSISYPSEFIYSLK